MSAVQEALEALGHSVGTLPEPRLLAALFVRFQAQVPLRRAPAGLGVEEALAAWLDDGAGCSGDLRTRAFETLALSAGFAIDGASARGHHGERRRVLLALDRRLLLDSSFPFPAPLSLEPPAELEPTGYGKLSVRSGPLGRLEILLETRGEERVLYQIEPGEALPDEECGRGANPEPGPEGLFRLCDDRLLRWRSGQLEISDSWSRLSIPFPASDVEGLEALFGPPIPQLEPPETAASPVPGPSLAVYHASAARAPHLRELLADPGVHAALLPEGWTVESLSIGEDGFERSLVEAGALLRKERVALGPDGIVVDAEGPLALFRTRRWRLEPRPTGTRLRLLATLRDPVPPRGLPEGTRRRLVFELASELLALDARATEG